MRNSKSQYTETEAAEELGVTVMQLRGMIRSHVVERDEDLTNVPQTTFQASDLVILRLLGRMQGARQPLASGEPPASPANSI
jgi:uncharacterized membrane protein